MGSWPRLGFSRTYGSSGDFWNNPDDNGGQRIGRATSVITVCGAAESIEKYTDEENLAFAEALNSRPRRMLGNASGSFRDILG